MSQTRVNLLCLAGAVIGVIAIFSRWVGNWLIDLNLLDVMNLSDSAEGASNYFLPGLVFIIGTLVAFLSPLGGVLQIIGSPWFIVVWANRHEGEILSSVGPYLGIASAIVVLISMVRPLGPGLLTGPFRTKSRLIAFSIERDKEMEKNGNGLVPVEKP